MTRWAAFAGITVAVLSLLLVLARASQSIVTGSDGDGAAAGPATRSGPPPTQFPDAEPAVRYVPPPPVPGESRLFRYGPEPPDSTPELTPGLLFANVALSQGVLGAIVLGAAWYAEVPASALGVSAAPASTGLPAVAVGVAFGLALAAANALGAGIARRLGYDPSAELRELLAPETRRGWVVLLGGVLPVVAVVEELLFRGALIGAFSVGFGVSPWLLAVASSVAFALGHGAQGRAGIAATGVLGFVLAAGFVVTGSLLVVIVAHYLVNAVEFVVHEGLGVEGPRPARAE